MKPASYPLLLLLALWSLALHPTITIATTIDAESMVAEQQQRVARFNGSVELVTDDLHLFSDHLVAYYSDHLGGQLDRAEATGHVRMQHKESRGRADHATLDIQHNLLTLSGSAELTESGRVIRAGHITHHLKSGNTTVTGGGEGERVHIHIDDDKDRTITPP
ncbi:MAG: LptA/OstA family protein [Mariprofundales bacterium]|nr:LptA/OstA family protein [Mariprofundales bacterium]